MGAESLEPRKPVLIECAGLAPMQKGGTPPYQSVCLDWLTFSKTAVEHMEKISLEVIRKFKSAREHRYFEYGYEGVDLAAFGTLSTRGSHLRVELNGQAMQYVRYVLGIGDQDVCQWFLNRGFNATRADGAVDSADKSLNPLIAFRYRQRGNTRCEASRCYFRLPKLSEGEPIFPKDGKKMSTYFGAESSERRIRIYDKLGQMIQTTGEVATDQYGQELDHLTRIEMVCRRVAAQMMVQQVCQHGLGVIRELIAGYLSFLDPRDKRKKRRRNVANWWTRIIGEKRSVLILPHAVSSPDQAMLWIKRQVTPTLRMMRDMAPDKFKELLETWVVEYESSPQRQKTWKVWADIREQRKNALAELIRVEADDNEAWRIEKMLAAASPTVNEEETNEI